MVYEALLGIGISQSLFLALLVLGKVPKSKGDWVLLLALVVWILRFGIFFSIHQGYYIYFPKLVVLSLSLFLLDGPLFFLYVSCFTIARRVRLDRYWGHFMAFFLLTFYGAFSLYHASREETFKRLEESLQFLFSSQTPSLQNNEQWFMFILAISFIFYALSSIRLLYLYQKKIKDAFSFTEKINLDWLKFLLGFWLLFFVLPLGLFFGSLLFPWPIAPYLDECMLVAFLILMYIPGYYALRPPYTPPNPLEQELSSLVAEPENDPAEASPQYQKSGLQEEQMLHFAKKLKTLMIEERPYLEAELNLKTLAELLQVSPNHLSQIINAHFQQNFFDFVNAHRVEEVKKRLLETKYQHYTLLAIAEDCGFKSKTSFNTAFKKFTGKTPSQYRNEGKRVS